MVIVKRIHEKQSFEWIDCLEVVENENLQRLIYDHRNIKDGVLWDKGLRLKAVNKSHKELHLRCCRGPRYTYYVDET